MLNRMTMLNRMPRENLRGPLLIGATLAVLSAGIPTAMAQVDDPPGARFQTEKNREAAAVPALPSPYSPGDSGPPAPACLCLPPAPFRGASAYVSVLTRRLYTHQR